MNRHIKHVNRSQGGNLGNKHGRGLAEILVFGWAAYLAIAALAVAGAVLFLILTGRISIPIDFSSLLLLSPFILVLALGLALYGLKGYYVSKRDAVKIRKAAIKEAETNLDTWTLIVQLKGQDAGDRISAARGLRNHNTSAVEEELTQAMLEDPDVDVRLEAYLALKFQGKEKLGLLLEQLKSGGDAKARLSLVELLRKTGDSRQAATLVYLYGFETDKSVKLGILDSLDKYYNTDARDLAVSILRKEDDRDIKLKALDIVSRYDNVAHEMLIQLKSNPNADVRYEAGKIHVSDGK